MWNRHTDRQTKRRTRTPGNYNIDYFASFSHYIRADSSPMLFVVVFAFSGDNVYQKMDMQQHFAVVKLLSYYNSEFNVANHQGVTPIDFAKKNGYIEIANYLDRMAKKTKFSEFDGNISLNLLSQF